MSKIISLVVINVCVGIVDAYVYAAPLFSLFLIVFNLFKIFKALRSLSLKRKIIIFISIACIPFLVCKSLTYFFEKKMLSSINPLIEAIHQFHEKNGYFPKKLSDMQGDYKGESTNQISNSGHYLIRYIYVNAPYKKWPAIEVKNKNYFYVIDSEKGEVIKPPREVID